MKTGELRDQPGRGLKPTRLDITEDVATAIGELSTDNVEGCSASSAVSRNLGVPYSTVENILRKMVHFSHTKFVTISICWLSTGRSN